MACCSLFSCLFFVRCDWLQSISYRDSTVGLDQSSHVLILAWACPIMKLSTSTGMSLIPSQMKIGQIVHVVPSLVSCDLNRPLPSLPLSASHCPSFFTFPLLPFSSHLFPPFFSFPLSFLFLFSLSLSHFLFSPSISSSYVSHSFLSL